MAGAFSRRAHHAWRNSVYSGGSVASGMVQLLGIFSFLVVLLRAAIMCAQSICVGGVIFLLLVARGANAEMEYLRRRAWKLIRWSALALAASQLFFLLSNSFMLTA